ncbi:MAG: SDR family NAD(P)-dependent oxidoreductase [Rubrivivax sp.]
MKFQGAVGIVTGGASGLGQATCRRMLAAGYRGVVAFDMDPARGAALEHQLGNSGFVFAQVDVSDQAAVDAAVEKVHEHFGEIHLVVNAAAIGLPAKLLGRGGPIPMEKFDRVMKVNLYGSVHVMRAAAAKMALNSPNEDGERGVIVNVASGAAFEGQSGQLAYSASKAALVGITLPLMRELAPLGIRVMTVAPGAFDTPMYSQAPAEVKESLVAQSLFPRRMGHADEFAMLIEEIARNPMHNGRTIRLDAGMILSAG